MTGGEVVVRTLAAHGVEHVFGIPGTHNLELYRHLGAHGIAHVTPRHEQGAGYAADGYARVSARPGVCLVTAGPALMNVLVAATTAYADSIPMLVVSPGLPRGLEGRDSGFLHELKDASGGVGRLLAWSRRVESAEEAGETIAEAFAGFRTERPRPVHVEVPLDVLEGATDPFAAAIRPAAVVAPDPDAIEQAADLLARARGAASIVVGGGARGAAAEVLRMAERLGAPVLSTTNGKAVLDENHPLAVGVALRSPRAWQHLHGERVVLAIGTELADTDLAGQRAEFGGTLLRIDVDRAQLHRNAVADLPLLGDAAAVLRRLEASLDERGVRAGAEGADGHRDGVACAAALRAALDQGSAAIGAPWAPICEALTDVLEPDAIVAGDSARVCYMGLTRPLWRRVPSSYLYPTGASTLGYGLPAAIGAKVARPDRQVVAVMGDGGLMFTLPELATAVELKLPLPLVVATDGGYGQIRGQMIERGIAPVGVDLLAPDFATVARGLGARGETLDGADNLPDALARALAADGPTLIDMRMEDR
ncbi:5-guanidino-2-oxopentanoate decarboxylase [Conexibacter stalactiti]|uniref:5-guanidino-2-oxopentanoate decarboxylase n=1 Tax=Conexibacter stalactiti TaxID=1940611 RepID=A0ABU4HJF6_9ACTN|nr:5-guanidino-2-oxopentanoate decarboxylase [Conexibacter stalactiti]MDW5593447.1 5-guanidino-2-oxopentanoate decarboxylase [Conexibacter stalactiti]MEC5034088.1 5-guanidino-2-oxopentanoate decarboxylase [Conexibacter stalactiti]